MITEKREKEGERSLGRTKQHFHLEPDRGLLNDPNGLVYFKGKYHVFFQWNRFAKNHCYKEWGLFTSKDLLKWTFQGSALLPDMSFDRDGVYSGSGYVIKDKLCLFYTGNTKPDGKRKVYQCMAISAEGEKFQKLGCVMDVPEEYTEHFRDPKVFRGTNGEYFMVIGAQRKNGKGAIALCHSGDGYRWKWAGTLAETEIYEMIECPDLFELNGVHVLLYNPQERDNRKDVCGDSFSAYKITAFDEEERRVTDRNLDQYQRLDYGFDFYAPQTFCDGLGRRLLFGWMSRMDEEEECVFSAEEENIHCLTLPRELYVQNGKLYQAVPKELDSLKAEEILAEWMSENEKKAAFPMRTAFIRLERSKDDPNLSIEFEGDGTKFIYDCKTGSVTLRRIRWTDSQEEEKRLQISILRTVEIWMDQSSLEFFLNDGEYVMSARIFPREAYQEVIFGGVTKRTKVECREIRRGGIVR